jgi:hypothetical protein
LSKVYEVVFSLDGLILLFDDSLHVRDYNGQNSSCYRAAVRQKAGRIIAAGMTKEVTLEPVDRPINNRIDDAYEGKSMAAQCSAPVPAPRQSR